MKINPKTWNQKQKIIGGTAVAVLLIGGFGFEIASANHHAKEIKAEQLKQEEDTIKSKKLKEEKLVQSQAKKSLDVAETTDTPKNIETAESLIKKVTDKKVQETFTEQLNEIKDRVKIEETANKAVSDYSKDATNQDKYKTAQQAIDKLTSNYSKALKEQLTKQLSDSKSQADKATKENKTKSSSKDKNHVQSIATGNEGNSNTGSNSSQNNTNSGQTNTQNNNSSSNANSNTGGQSNSNVTPTPTPTPSPSPAPSPTPAPTPTPNPQPTYKYLDWISVDGVRKYTKMCNSVGEANTWLNQMMNSQEIINQGFDHSINYGTETIES